MVYLLNCIELNRFKGDSKYKEDNLIKKFHKSRELLKEHKRFKKELSHNTIFALKIMKRYGEFPQTFIELRQDYIDLKKFIDMRNTEDSQDSKDFEDPLPIKLQVNEDIYRE